ncbi:MAG TPA: hypothetical protein VMS62_14645 [Gemmatimonadales bacterium]|nr:hypothetical protein [Gemmatimonadales bacterium]
MSGHVFHPGHSALHGMTVVVETAGAATYVGRYDREDSAGVHLLDVGVHDVDSAIAKEEYIKRSSKFGVRGEHRHVVVPAAKVARITQLGNWEPARSS